MVEREKIGREKSFFELAFEKAPGTVDCSFCKCILADLDMETTIKICKAKTEYPYPDINYLIDLCRPGPIGIVDNDELIKAGIIKASWKKFILDLGRELKIDRIANWLESKLKKGES